MVDGSYGCSHKKKAGKFTDGTSRHDSVFLDDNEVEKYEKNYIDPNAKDHENVENKVQS